MSLKDETTDFIIDYVDLLHIYFLYILIMPTTSYRRTTHCLVELKAIEFMFLFWTFYYWPWLTKVLDETESARLVYIIKL